jgi:hypothetical protein
MYNSKLIGLLKTFSLPEFKEFEKFVVSPYHSRGRNLLPLYKYLKKFYPDFTHKDLEIKNVFKKIYPGRVYNMQLMRKLCSELEKMGEDYLVEINMRKSDFEYYKRLSDELQSRGLFKQFETNIMKAGDQFLNKGININYFKNHYELSLVKEDAYFKINNPGKNLESVLAGSVHFILYCLMESMGQIRNIELIKHYTKQDVNELLVNVFYNNLEIEKILEFINVNLPVYGSILEMQYCSLKISMGFKDDGLIENIWDLYNKNFEILNWDSKYSYYYFISGASAVVSENNPEKYNKLTFEILNFGLKYSLYVPDGENYMDLYFFRLCISTGVDLKEFKWVKNFIENYIDKLKPENRENMRFYGYMLYNFYIEDFEKANYYVSKIKFDIFQFNYDIRLITLLIYYELSYIEEAFSLIDSFKHFIVENKSVTEKRKGHYLNFISFYEQLLKYKAGDKSILLNKLKADIIKTENLGRKEWFIEKVNEMDY